MARVTQYGEAQNVFSRELCNKIRKKLKIKNIKDMPDNLIRKVIKLSNDEIAKWILDNPEGFKLQDMGYLAISKYLPKEYLENKQEIIEYIKTLPIYEGKRKKLIKKFSVDIGKFPDFNILKTTGELVPNLNLHSFFHIYKPMWFNKKNCILRKAMVYKYVANPKIKRELSKNIFAGKEYCSYDLRDFAHYKMKEIE